MKKFSSEFVHNYKTYSFGFANYCLREKGDKLSEIYSQGYLPYSGSSGMKNVFYMARSARVPLRSFEFSSENRRIAKKIEYALRRERIPVENFDVNDKRFLNFCLNYFAKRHGPKVFPENRLLTILNSGVITDIVIYKIKEQPVAYVFESSDEEMTHFWFSFYDLAYIKQFLGLWLMLDSAQNAKKRGAYYFYVGTVYGDKVFYKTAFKNLEYWNGCEWISDVKKLKILSRSDDQRMVNKIDAWKQDIEIF